MLRTDIAYVDGAGRLTQAGFQAFQEAFTSIAALQAADAVEAANAPGTAPRYACRAWVNLNGTGTVAIRASGNVASITDNGVGDYTITFTTAMPDANYAICMAYSNEVNVQHTVGFILSQAAGSFRVQFYSATNSALTADKLLVHIAVFR